MSHHQLEYGPRFDPTNQPEVRLGFLDVDETLLPQHLHQLPTERVRVAADQAGEIIPIGLVTARSLPKVAYLIANLNMWGPSILNNGAQIWDSEKGHMAVERSLPVSTAYEITRALQHQELDFSVQDSGFDYRWDAALKSYCTKRNPLKPLTTDNERPVPDFAIEQPFFISVHHVTADQIAGLSDIARQYSSEYVDLKPVHEYIASDGSKTYDVFFADERADKDIALEVALDIAGQEAANTLFVGDGLNDRGIMGTVGTGVAMGNAAEATKAVATHIAPSREHDGAAVALEELVLKRP